MNNTHLYEKPYSIVFLHVTAILNFYYDGHIAIVYDKPVYLRLKLTQNKNVC